MQKLVVTCASPPPVATVLRSSLATRTSAPSDSSTSTSHAGRSMRDSGRSRAILSMRSLLTHAPHVPRRMPRRGRGPQRPERIALVKEMQIMIAVDHKKPAARLQKTHPAPVRLGGRRQVPEHAPRDDQVQRRRLHPGIRHVAQPEVRLKPAALRVRPRVLEHLGRQVHARHPAAESRQHDAEDPRTAARIKRPHPGLRPELRPEQVLKHKPRPSVKLIAVVKRIAFRACVPVVAHVVRECHGASPFFVLLSCVSPSRSSLPVHRRVASGV